MPDWMPDRVFWGWLIGSGVVVGWIFDAPWFVWPGFLLSFWGLTGLLAWASGDLAREKALSEKANAHAHAHAEEIEARIRARDQ